MIKLNQVTKIFDSRSIAGLRGISFEIPRGTIFALMGPNGSGKTTLLNAIMGNCPLDSGLIEVEGKIHLFEKKNPSTELNVQKFLVDVIKNQEIQKDKRIQLSRDMADIFEFTFQLRQNIGELSQGQLQKVLMAAELINHPDILFLDEPFIHLDPMSRKDILASLFSYLRQREVTVIWITHEKDEAFRFADQIGLIQHGKIEQISSPEMILKQPRNLFVAQYFGHENFIKLTKKNNLWPTPWGDQQFDFHAQEVFLVIPPLGWRIDKNSSFEGEILEFFPQYYYWEIKIQVDEKFFKVHLSFDSQIKLNIGKKIKLSANLSQCFVMGL